MPMQRLFRPHDHLSRCMPALPGLEEGTRRRQQVAQGPATDHVRSRAEGTERTAEARKKQEVEPEEPAQQGGISR